MDHDGQNAALTQEEIRADLRNLFGGGTDRVPWQYSGLSDDLAPSDKVRTLEKVKVLSRPQQVDRRVLNKHACPCLMRERPGLVWLVPLQNDAPILLWPFRTELLKPGYG